MKVRPVAALAAASVALGGCSVLFVKGPAPGPAGQTDCTRRQTLPLLDFGGAIALAYTAAGVHVGTQGESSPVYQDAPAMAILAGAAAAAVSGVVGMRRTAACNRVKDAEELTRIMRPLEAAAAPTRTGDPWLAAGAPPAGFASPPPRLAAPDGGAEVGP